ncbi:MAG: LPS export ABC transporter permease LptF [Pseudomonadota bacterium]
MTSLDRYILGQLVWPFVFFVLVFTGVIWLSQSLRVIDTVVNNGQSARVFLEFTLLLLPTVLSIVLPVACFAATLYAVNRLYTDSEIVVMMASGLSGVALLRPVVLFAAGVMATLLLITLFLMPYTKGQMQQRVTEVRGDVAAAFLREGAFVSPVKNVTIYLRRMGRPGEMLGVFVHDARDPGQETTYTAERAVLVPGKAAPQIVMFDGIAQSRPAEVEAPLSVLRFRQLSYDLGLMRSGSEARRRKPSEYFLYDQLTISGDALGPYKLGDFRAEGHEALSSPLYAMGLPLMGAALVVSLGFRRQGFIGRILLAAGGALALRLAGLAAKSATNAEAAFWPLMYLPPIFGIALAIWLMSFRGQHSRHGAQPAPAVP